jgi:hypothetical protein
MKMNKEKIQLGKLLLGKNSAVKFEGMLCKGRLPFFISYLYFKCLQLRRGFG